MSEKKLRDYIGYYIGCRCLNTWFPEGHEEYNKQWILTGYNKSAVKCFYIENEKEYTHTDSIKPILKRLDDMTEEEALDVAVIYSGADKVNRTKGTVNNFFYFFCDFKFGEKGVSETLIMHNGEAWYEHYFDRKKRGRYHNIINQFTAHHYLLDKHFDLFGLIQEGLAIDTSTLNLK